MLLKLQLVFLSMVNLRTIVGRFGRKKIIVLGDIILDNYVYGRISRVSPEAPVPVFEIEREVYSPGGAGNTAANITSLGGDAYLIGVLGIDKNSGLMMEALKEKKVNVENIVLCENRPTTVKMRFIALNQHVVRVDKEDNSSIKPEVENKILSSLEDLIGSCRLVVVSDYAKGVITKNIMERLNKLAYDTGKMVIIDPKPKNKMFYKDFSFIIPNLMEAREMAGDFGDYRDLGKKLVEELNSNVLLTRGGQGMSLFLNHGAKRGICEDLDAVVREIHDLTGAGDTVTAVFALSLSSNAPYYDAAKIANYAAGIVVGKLGTSTTTRRELLNAISTYKT